MFCYFCYFALLDNDFCVFVVGIVFLKVFEMPFGDHFLFDENGIESSPDIRPGSFRQMIPNAIFQDHWQELSVVPLTSRISSPRLKPTQSRERKQKQLSSSRVHLWGGSLQWPLQQQRRGSNYLSFERSRS